MSKNEEIEKLEKAIQDSEIRLKSIYSNIEQLDREINALTPRKLELERNIEFHKKQETVPIVNEHRKTRAELSKITARLILISSDRKKSVQASLDVESIIDKFKRDHMQLLKASENNVLKVMFGGKRGKR